MNKFSLPVGLLLVLVSGFANATVTAQSFTDLTDSVLLTGVTTAILAVAAAKVVPKVAAYGAAVVLRFIGR